MQDYYVHSKVRLSRATYIQDEHAVEKKSIYIFIIVDSILVIFIMQIHNFIVNNIMYSLSFARKMTDDISLIMKEGRNRNEEFKIKNRFWKHTDFR